VLKSLVYCVANQRSIWQGTIVAQVALTSLVLPSLSEAHWVARSAFILSLISGCLAVYYVSLLQRELGNFRTPEQVREWWHSSRNGEAEIKKGRERENRCDYFSWARERGLFELENEIKKREEDLENPGDNSRLEALKARAAYLRDAQRDYLLEVEIRERYNLSEQRRGNSSRDRDDGGEPDLAVLFEFGRTLQGIEALVLPDKG